MNEALINSQGIKLIELIDKTSRVYIWKAFQTKLDRTVFLIVLREEIAADERECECFLMVARQIAKLKCDSIAAIFDIVSDNALHYVIMEYVEGATLDEIVRTEGALPFKRVMQIATSLSTSLKLLWNKARIIHCNLKGSTIRFDNRGVAKLIDFSRAMIDSPEFYALVPDNSEFFGSPPFVAPETVNGTRHFTIQSDMYSLGALLYYISTGAMPFSGQSTDEILASHLSESLIPPHRLNTNLPVNFSRLLHRLMIKDAAYRYHHWEEVHHDLHAVMEGKEPICANLDIDHLSSIEADFSQVETTEEAQPTSIKIKTKQRNQYLADMQEKHVQHHHAIDQNRARKKMQFTLWAALILWFALLFWFRSILQTDPEQQKKVLRARDKIGSVIDELLPTVPSSESPETEPLNADDPMLTQTPSADNERMSLQLEPLEIPSELQNALALSFKKGDIAGAIHILSNIDNENITAQSSIIKILQTLPEPEQLVAAHLRDNLNKPLVMNFNGVPRTVTPRSVRNNTVVLEANGRSVEFNITDLSVEQKSLWINVPRTIEEHIVLCLLLLQTDDASKATAYAAECGPLAAVIETAAKMKTPEQ